MEIASRPAIKGGIRTILAHRGFVQETVGSERRLELWRNDDPDDPLKVVKIQWAIADEIFRVELCFKRESDRNRFMHVADLIELKEGERMDITDSPPKLYIKDRDEGVVWLIIRRHAGANNVVVLEGWLGPE